MIVPLFLQWFAKTNNVDGINAISIHLYNPIKHMIKNIISMIFYIYYVDNPDFESPHIFNSLTISRKVGNSIEPSYSGSASWCYWNKICTHLKPRSYTGIILNLWLAMLTFRKQPSFKWRFSCIWCINDTTLILSTRNI